MKFNTKALVKYASMAFGKRWKWAMRDACGLSRESLYRYEHGISQMSEENGEQIRVALLKHFRKEADQIQTAIKNLEAMA